MSDKPERFDVPATHKIALPSAGEADPPGSASVPAPEVRTGNGEPEPGGSRDENGA